MDIRFPSEGMELHSYCGLVFNMPAELIPERLASEIARVGHLSLWEYQHFTNHEHPTIGEEDYAAELELAQGWATALQSAFPDKRFVVEISPFDRTTWYQPLGDAPIDDEEVWELYSPPVCMSGAEMKAGLLEVFSALKTGEGGVGAFTEQQKANFKARTARRGPEGVCEKCGSDQGFSEPTVERAHRGVRMMNCLACEARVVHSTRTIRDRIGF
ncbi:MAG: hypothetical protein JSS66_17335 [Armatimonadetes bacterium]|nr:hypothetical protein [Armatimonadota bacterium]